MRRDEFEELIGLVFEQAKEIRDTKGEDYAGSDDVVSNFKRQAAGLGLRPEQVWAVYAGKHWDAIQTFCRVGDVASEPIVGRVHDMINYCLLLLAIDADNTKEAAALFGRVQAAGAELKARNLAEAEDE